MADYPFYSSLNVYARDMLIAMFLVPLIALCFPGSLRMKCNCAVGIFAAIFLVWLGIQASNVYTEYSFVSKGGSFQPDGNGTWAFSGPQRVPYTDQDYPAVPAPAPKAAGNSKSSPSAKMIPWTARANETIPSPVTLYPPQSRPAGRPAELPESNTPPSMPQSHCQMPPNT